MSKYLISILLFCAISIKGQSVYEPVSSEDIYDYLLRLSIKGVIEYDGNVKPVTRKEMAGYLLTADSSKIMLSALEKEELKFYNEEYYYEILRLSGKKKKSVSEFVKFGESGRLSFFKYYSDSFSLFADPIYGYNFEYFKDDLRQHRWNGFRVFGHLNSSIGYWLDFRDNLEEGDHINRTKEISPETGVNLINNDKNSIEYSSVNAGISYSWNWGDVTLAKDHFTWGSGNNSNIIFSTKAPSFPFFRLNVKPVDWLSFTYIHGWLDSRVLDSSSVRETLVANRESVYQVPKYMAAHILTVRPFENLNVSLGESVMYSDKIDPLYLIPIIFFRIADQYKMEESSSNTDSGDNIQLFADVNYILEAIRTQFYTTIFVDELSVTSILKNENGPSAIAYTFGLRSIDPVVENSEVTIEYSRLNPFVYMNSNDAQLFTNAGYQLGHWVGSNGDDLFLSYNQKLMRGLDVTISYERIRKGQIELPIEQYELPYPDFLYGEKRNEITYGLKAKYQVLHDLFAEAEYKYMDISDEEEGRTPDYLLGNYNRITVGLYYGI